MKLYNKRHASHFPIVIFPFICSNFPVASAYWVYIWFYQNGSCNWYHQHPRVFFINNIFVKFGGRVFQQTFRYKLCSFPHQIVPLFVWVRLHTWASQEKWKESSPLLYFTFRYIDDVLSLNNTRFSDFVDCIYPIEINYTTDTARSAANLDLHLEVDSERRLRTKLYDKRDDFNFPIVKFPFICSNIPATPVYEVYIS